MSAALEPEQDTTLAIQLMSVRKTASDEEFGKLLSQLLGTCRHEGFRIAIKALQIVLNESNVEKVAVGLKAIEDKPKVVAVPPRKPTPETPIKPIVPMRTREDALAVHRQNHPELYNADGTRKTLAKDGIEAEKTLAEEDDEALERATRPDPPAHTAEAGYKFKGPTGKARKVDDAGREDIRRRAKQGRMDGMGRYPKGFIKRLASEYDVSEALIYQIIYSDPGYEAVIKP